MAWAVRGWAVRKPAVGGIDEDGDLPFAIFSVASVWLNPVAWEHYNATLLFPVALVLFTAWRQAGRHRIAWGAAMTAVVLFVAWLLSLNMYLKNSATTNGAVRWYVTANWLPWPLTLLALGALWWRREREPTTAGAGARPA
jgi:hypothetical protein